MPSHAAEKSLPRLLSHDRATPATPAFLPRRNPDVSAALSTRTGAFLVPARNLCRCDCSGRRSKRAAHARLLGTAWSEVGFHVEAVGGVHLNGAALARHRRPRHRTFGGRVRALGPRTQRRVSLPWGAFSLCLGWGRLDLLGLLGFLCFRGFSG